MSKVKSMYAIEEFIDNQWCKADDRIFDSVIQAEQYCAYLEATRSTVEDNSLYRARSYSLVDF